MSDSLHRDPSPERDALDTDRDDGMTDDVASAVAVRPRIRWGEAWRDRLLDQGWLDTRSVQLGRSVLARSEVDDLLVEPGRTTRVWNSPGMHEAVHIDVAPLSPDEQEVLASVVASKARHTAALLDGDLERALVRDLAERGVSLLAAPEDLTPVCACDEKHPFCNHAVSLMHATLHDVTREPLLVFVLRGVDPTRLLSEVGSRRRGERADDPPAAPSTIDAHQAWTRTLGELPVPPRAPVEPGRIGRWARDHRGRDDSRPGADAPMVETELLGELARDTVTRAWALLRGDATSSLDLPEDADIARRAVGLLGTSRISELARRMDEPAQRIIGLATAWDASGPAGLALLGEDPWQPEPWIMDEAARMVIASGRRESSVDVELNAVTVGGRLQFRYGRDQLWYRLDRRADHWMVLTPPDPDLAALIPPLKGRS